MWAPGAEFCRHRDAADFGTASARAFPNPPRPGGHKARPYGRHCLDRHRPINSNAACRGAPCGRPARQAAAAGGDMRELMIQLNEHQVLRHQGRTRRQLFEEIDRPALRPLPATRYVYAEWRVRRAGLGRVGDPCALQELFDLVDVVAPPGPFHAWKRSRHETIVSHLRCGTRQAKTTNRM